MFENMWAYRAVLEGHRELIKNDEVRLAFDVLIEFARQLPRYEFIPTFGGSLVSARGAGRVIRYRDGFRWDALFAPAKPEDLDLPPPETANETDWHVPANRAVQHKRRWRVRPGDLPYAVLSTIAIGGATVETVQAAVKTVVVTKTRIGSHTAIGVMRWLAADRGCSFTSRNGVLTGTAPMLNMDPATPFEFFVRADSLVFSFNGAGIGRLGGRVAVEGALRALGFTSRYEDDQLNVDVLTQEDALKVQGFVFGQRPPVLKAAVGRPYVSAGRVKPVAQPDPFIIDPSVIDRGNQGHATTQDALAEFLAAHSIEPRSPKEGEPDFDLAWQVGARLFVAEVKSTTATNEESQLRLGLGQVLRYLHALAAQGLEVTAVLVPEHAPSDSSWRDVCASVGALLVWPGNFEELLINETEDEV